MSVDLYTQLYILSPYCMSTNYFIVTRHMHAHDRRLLAVFHKLLIS